MSYYEWVQNNKIEQWDEDEVNGKLKVKMQRATEDVIDKQKEINDSLDALEKQRKKKDPSGEPPSTVESAHCSLCPGHRAGS